MVALSELEALARGQGILAGASRHHPYRLASAATVFMSVAFYIHRSLCAVYKDTGRMDLRDMVAALEAMQLDLLSMSYEPEDLDPDSVMRMQVAQQTLLRAVELLRAAHEQEYGHSDGKILL